MWGIAGYVQTKRNVDHKPKGKAGGGAQIHVGCQTRQRAREEIETKEFKTGRLT